MRLNASTAKVIARPGNTEVHHSPDTILEAPSLTSTPHSAVGGLIPRPKKLRPDASRIDQPMVSEA